MKISFYRRHRAGSENKYLKDCLSGELDTDGFFMRRLLSHAATLYPGRSLLFTPSCTLALELSISCLNLRPGDEVILPSFNFPSAANAVLRGGGTPVLCDISPDTQNISVPDAARRITRRTKAVIAVHYAGIACPMEPLLKLAGEAGIALVEDAAQGASAFYRGTPLGALGDFGAVSYHHTKNITCGEGGLMVTGNREAYVEACQYRLHGTNRSQYINGEADRYTWNRPGLGAALSEPCAAILLAQMEEAQAITSRRVAVMGHYRELLEPLEKAGAFSLMQVPDYAEPNGHIFYLRTDTADRRERLQGYLLSRGIDCRTHYVPLHLSPMGRKLGYAPQDCPESLRCYGTLLRLPIHTGITDDDALWVAEKIGRFYKKG